MVRREKEAVVVAPERMGLADDRKDADYGSFEVDIGNLLIVDPSPVDKDSMQENVEEACRKMGTAMVQKMVNDLFSLPSTAAPVGRMVELPKPQMLVPRHKPLPKPKELTRWEKFAQEKGIKKRKRDKHVFDENTGEWRRRYGYHRVNDINDVAIIEAKASDKVGEDPFTQHRKEKKERVQRQKERQLVNLKAAAKSGGKRALPPTISLSRPLDNIVTLNNGGFKRPSKADLLETAVSAAGATASMGKFDAKSKMDSSIRKKGKRRQYAPVVGKGGAGVSEQEKIIMSDTVRKVVKSGSGPILDVKRAVKTVQPADIKPKKYKTPKKRDRKERQQQ